MFNIIFRGTKTMYSKRNQSAISISNPEMLDIVEPTIGYEQVLAFVNGEVRGAITHNTYTTTNPLFEYEPWKNSVRVFVYSNIGEIENIYEYTKIIPISSMTVVNTEYLWKKLYIPFSFKNGIFVLDKKKLRSKKTKKVSIADWVDTL
jgi:hypothetical protein